MNELYNTIGDWMVALIVGAIVAGVASWLWLGWFSPPAIVVFAGVTAMTLFALSRLPPKDSELERMLQRDEVESG